MFRSIDHPVIAVANRRTLHSAHVGARIGFAHCEAIHAIARNGWNEIFLNLISCAGAQNVGRASHDVVQGVGGCTKLAIYEGGVERVEAATAVLRGHVAGVDASSNGFLAHVFFEFLGNMPKFLHCLFVRHQLALYEGSCCCDNCLLFFCQFKIHGVSYLVFLDLHYSTNIFRRW